MNWILGLLFPEDKVKRQINSVIRKVILSFATLIAAKLPFFADLGAYLTSNADTLSLAITASIMGVISVVWGTEEKKR